MCEGERVGDGSDAAHKVATLVAHVPHHLHEKRADKHIPPADPGLQRQPLAFEKQGQKDECRCPVERRGEVLDDIDVFQPPRSVQSTGEKTGKAFVVVQKPDEDDECRRQQRRLPELKGDDKRDDGEQVEGRVRDESFVPEGVFQPFGVVGRIFAVIGKPVVLVDRKGQEEDAENGPSIDRDTEIHRPARRSERGEQREMQFVSEKIVRHRAFFLTVVCKGPPL